jgi:putative transposase
VPRSSIRYKPKRDDGPLRDRLADLMQRYPSYGYRRLTRLLREQGHVANHKRVLRICRELRQQNAQDAC